MERAIQSVHWLKIKGLKRFQIWILVRPWKLLNHIVTASKWCLLLGQSHTAEGQSTCSPSPVQFLSSRHHVGKETRSFHSLIFLQDTWFHSGGGCHFGVITIHCNLSQIGACFWMEVDDFHCVRRLHDTASSRRKSTVKCKWWVSDGMRGGCETQWDGQQAQGLQEPREAWRRAWRASVGGGGLGMPRAVHMWAGVMRCSLGLPHLFHLMTHTAA